MKYMGSKSRICKYIVPIIQEYIDKNNIKKYWEPFVGGANVIDKIKCAKKVGSDKNKYLIALLNRMKQNGELFETVSKELYDKARDCFNSQTKEFEDWELGNIGFLASYNGRWFDGGRVYEDGDKYIDAIWCEDGYSWTYHTNIPHATFNIYEGSETYCKGIVFEEDSE